jgi:hypothetical protein
MARKPRNVGTVEVAIVRYGWSLGDGPKRMEYTAEVRNVRHSYGLDPADCIGDTFADVVDQLVLALSTDIMATGHGPLTGTIRVVEDHIADDHAIATAEQALARDYIDATQPAYEPAHDRRPAPWTSEDEDRWQRQKAEIAAERASETAFVAAWLGLDNDMGAYA